MQEKIDFDMKQKELICNRVIEVVYDRYYRKLQEGTDFSPWKIYFNHSVRFQH